VVGWLQGERPFNAKEEGQLQAMLGLHAAELQQLTSLCIYTLQQAAFHNMSTQVRPPSAQHQTNPTHVPRRVQLSNSYQ
jgi:hypothetical protein